jgi:D-3-phosphoglycerate dehydrogenase
MKVGLVDTVHADLPKGLQALGFDIKELYQEQGVVLINALQDCTGLVIRSRFSITDEWLEQLPQLKFIARVGAGLENIDLLAAAKKQISLFSAPEGNRNAVSEHALGMLLMLFNNLKRADQEVRNGQWLRAENRGVELDGKTVGIIGYGNMGQAFAKKLSGFDVNIMAHDKYKSGFGTDQVKEATLADIQKEAEVLSLHIPQTEETIAMVNESFLNGFQKAFYLINTARGKIVNTKALVGALKNGKVLGACLDVLEYEKKSFENLFEQNLPEAFDYLVKAENVILSPHIAGWTHESNQKMAQVILDKIGHWQKTQSWK